MKKRLSLVAALLALALVFSACAAKPSAPSTTPSENTASQDAPSEANPADMKATLKFENFSAAGDNEQYLKEMIASFNKEYPNVTIEMQTIGYEDYFTQMQAKVAAGQAPDIYELNFENFYSYAKKGVLLPLDDVIASTGFDVSKYNQMAIDAFKVDGKQYGVPNSFSNVLLFYNKDLFDKAGIAYPTNDWTWKERQEASEKIKAVDKNTFGIFQPITFNELYKTVKQNGGSLFNADMTAFTMNTPQNVETLQFMLDTVSKTNVMPNEEQLAGMGDWDLFKAGRLGMLVTGVWAIPDFTTNCDFAWDIAVEPGKTAKATHFFSNGYTVSKDTANAEAAFAFISYITSAKEPVDIRLNAGWELPPVSDQAVLDAYKAKTPPENRQAVFDSLNYLVTPPVIEQYAEFTDIVNKYLNEAKSGKITAEKALADCQKELETTIKLS